MSAAPDDDDARERSGDGPAPAPKSGGRRPPATTAGAGARTVADPGAKPDAASDEATEEEIIEIPLDVDAVRAGLRLDRFIASRIVRLSRTRIQGIIAAGRVRSAETGRVLRRPAIRVRLGQRLIIERPAPREPKVVLDYGVLYEDADLLVLNKPAGLPVHPSASYHRHTLTYLLRQRLGSGHGWELAHRLDRETSGVLVLGRRGRGASGSILKRAFFERAVAKRYWAIARGVIDAPTRIELPLGPAPGSKIRVKMGEVPVDAGGQPARTDVRPLASGSFRGEPVTLVEAAPRTGRQHQIRVHLALFGHPLVGDKLYGLAEERFIAVADGLRTLDELGDELGIRRHALHAIALSLDHPRTGERMTFRAPWPDELAAIVRPPAAD
jgi:23S rRNA pseudouridine1911/1915/1917 synthase